jgi:dihydroorotase
MRKAMDYAKAFGIPIISHAEDWNLVGQGVMNEGALSNLLGLRGNPAAAEEIMVAREIALCRLTRTPIHIAHISTKLGLEHVRRAKEDGLPVTAEVSPHHLCLTEECVRTYDTNFKMAPPLRTAEDVEALQKGLKSGIIDIIATDHAPHGEIDKALEFDQAANGIIGLQTAAPVSLKLVHDEILSPLQWVKTLTLNPAKLLNLPLGTLKIGSEADITLIQPHQEWTFNEESVFSKSKNSPFLGWKLKGSIFATLVAGKLVYRKEA